SEIKGFKTIQTEISSKQKNLKTLHQLFVKEHVNYTNDPATPSGRTLFLLNLPVDATQQDIKKFFGSAGKVLTVDFKSSNSHKLNSSINKSTTPTEKALRHLFQPNDSTQFNVPGNFALVVFLEEEGLKKVFKWGNKVQKWELQRLETNQIGLNFFKKQYQEERVDMDKLTVFVNEYISELEKHKAKQEKIQLKSSNEPDEDGFVTVSYTNSNKGASNDGITVKAFKADEVIEVKKKEQSSFYRFQTRENKRDQLAQLRSKFEEDKKKIANMKAKRQFKPY
ncbi:hypothetical protein CONCODRAFT_79347, partial [Conidiobolus coronatus NRRL 28638]